MLKSLIPPPPKSDITLSEDTFRKMYGFIERLRTEGFEVLKTRVPETSPEAEEFRTLCEKNECGCYGTNWGCPPGTGSIEECSEILKGYSEAYLVRRRYVVDPKNAKDVRRVSDEMIGSTRRAGDMIRPFAPVKILGDGGCRYCGTCTYPDAECRYPLQRVDSVSAYGIDMGKYLKDAGKELTFEKGAVTLNTIILIGRPTGKY